MDQKKTAIYLKTNEDKDFTMKYFFMDPPIRKEKPFCSSQTNSESHLISISFWKKPEFCVLQIWFVDRMLNLIDTMNLEDIHPKIKGYDPATLDPKPVLKALGYDS